jgi:hypothetical protein
MRTNQEKPVNEGEQGVGVCSSQEAVGKVKVFVFLFDLFSLKFFFVCYILDQVLHCNLSLGRNKN